eukprot:NODE_319_length_11107_cov_0.311228.p3 type:complete len:296 gc:universal NODE_319_length_11107_cov_0.311228:4069-4956(+)
MRGLLQKGSDMFILVCLSFSIEQLLRIIEDQSIPGCNIQSFQNCGVHWSSTEELRLATTEILAAMRATRGVQSSEALNDYAEQLSQRIDKYTCPSQYSSPPRHLKRRLLSPVPQVPNEGSRLIPGSPETDSFDSLSLLTRFGKVIAIIVVYMLAVLSPRCIADFAVDTSNFGEGKICNYGLVCKSGVQPLYIKEPIGHFKGLVKYRVKEVKGINSNTGEPSNVAMKYIRNGDCVVVNRGSASVDACKKFNQELRNDRKSVEASVTLLFVAVAVALSYIFHKNPPLRSADPAYFQI